MWNVQLDSILSFLVGMWNLQNAANPQHKLTLLLFYDLTIAAAQRTYQALAILVN
jgi:hypothetical protein